VKSNNPIGVFDSGIGGLSIAQQIRDSLPKEDIIYVADTFNAPYGEKSNEFIIQRSLAITDYLVQRGAKAIVVACNTATTAAIQQLRSIYEIPIVGVEPGTKPAALNSKSGVVGVLATPRTLATQSFERLLERTSGSVKMELQPCPDLVHQVEILALEGPETELLVNRYLKPLLERGADHIVLGCTHYNFLDTMIRKLSGPNVTVINTVKAVTNQVVRQLETHQLVRRDENRGKIEFWTTGNREKFQIQIDSLWGQGYAVDQLLC